MYTFEEIVGNEHIIKNFQSAIKNEKLCHAYIIDGFKGLGKKLLANTLAKTIQCEKNSISACCKCISCQTFDSGNNPDIIYLKPTNTKSIGVDDIRERINNIIQIKPYKYKYKIFIIENADAMTIAAQNSILKTIEEPPSYAIFLLLATNSNNFLPTILSRCALIKLKPLKENIIKNYISKNLDIPENQIAVYTSFAQGSIGQVKEIATSDIFIQLREEIIQLFIQLKSKDIIQIFETAKEWELYKEEINNILSICLLWYRDILTAKNLENKKYIIQKDKLDLIKKQAEQLDYDSIFKSIDIIEDTKLKLQQNANFQLTIEIMLLKLYKFNGGIK